MLGWIMNREETLLSYSNFLILYERKDQIIYNRLRIGHNRLTDSYLIEHTNCNQLLSFKHNDRMYFIWSNTTSVLFLYRH